jgi:hypothetical protein
MGPPSATVTQGQTVLLLGFDVSHRGIFRTAQVVVKKFFEAGDLLRLYTPAFGDHKRVCKYHPRRRLAAAKPRFD